MKNVLIFLAISLLFSCSKAKEEGGVMIRVKNATPVALSDVVVYSFSKDQSAERERAYGTIHQNLVSGYQPHEYVYDWPLLSYTINSNTTGIQILNCPTGIGTIAPGWYTLLIEGDASAPVFRFIKD